MPFPRLPRPHRLLATLAAFPLALAVAACDISVGQLTGRASDEWTHTYPLAAGGQVRIGNSNGRIEVEAVDGDKVEVKAERIARAATDEGARELLPRINIKEDVTPDRVAIETEKIGGMLIGVQVEVRYRVRAPKGAAIDVSNTNGSVLVSSIAGSVKARTTNGSVTTKALTGPVDARTTNGSVNVDVASVAAKQRIELHTTNGSVTLHLPDDAKASLAASWTNGGIRVADDVKVEVSERSRRRFEGTMNGGGAPIELHTTNGGIRLRSRADAVNTDDDDDHEAKTSKVLKSTAGERR